MTFDQLLQRRNALRNDLSFLGNDVSPTVEDKKEAVRIQLREVQREIDEYQPNK